MTIENNTPESALSLLFDSHLEAEKAIQSLGKSGFDMHKLSLVGKGFHTEEHPMGFYSTGDKIRAWGAKGAFWGGIWGFLLAPAVFFLPGIGLIAMAGPLVAALVGGLESAVAVGGISALAAALTRVGVPNGDVVRYETALKVDKYVLLVHGSTEDLAKAGVVLANTSAVPAIV